MKLKLPLGSLLATTAVATLVVGAGLSTPAVAQEEITIRMAVPDWPPTRIMKQLADEFYQAPSGNKVTLEPDFIPWPDFQNRLSASLTSGEQRYHMAVSDSHGSGNSSRADTIKN